MPIKKPQVICVTGAKGGVGKTNVSIHLAIALQRLHRQVMLFDADLSLANIDVLLGLNNKLNLSDVLAGRHSLNDIIMQGPNGIRCVPASSGVQHLSELNDNELSGIINAFDEIEEHIDCLIVDTASGVSKQVLNFVRACNEIIIVVCNEPGSITDAYAQIKILSQDLKIRRFRVLSNMVRSQHEGKIIFNKLKKTADQFLDVMLDYIGSIPYDEHVRLAILQQKTVFELYPHSISARAFEKLALNISQWPITSNQLDGSTFFLERFLQPNVVAEQEAIA